MGTRQHLAFLDATRATCGDELRRIQAVNNELQPLAEAWSVRRELRKHLRQLTRARHDSERILAEVQRVAAL